MCFLIFFDSRVLQPTSLHQDCVLLRLLLVVRPLNFHDFDFIFCIVKGYTTLALQEKSTGFGIGDKNVFSL
jgi:hypothetical protein